MQTRIIQIFLLAKTFSWVAPRNCSLMRKTAGYFRGYGLRSERRRQFFVHLGGRAGSQPRHQLPRQNHQAPRVLPLGQRHRIDGYWGKGFTMHWMWPTTSILPKMMKMTFLTAILIRKELGWQHEPTAAQKGGLALAKFLPRWPSMFWHVWILKIALNYVWNQNETITVYHNVTDNFQCNPKLFYQVLQPRYSMRSMAIWCTWALCVSCCEGEIWASTPLEAYPEAGLQPQKDYFFQSGFLGCSLNMTYYNLWRDCQHFELSPVTSCCIYIYPLVCICRYHHPSLEFHPHIRSIGSIISSSIIIVHPFLVKLQQSQRTSL